jgi:drug/metabolite transporter (DMT)-like permease
LNIGLFILTLIAWGSSWIAIKFQLVIDPSVSVAYRFLAAGLILQIFFRLTGKKPLSGLTKKDHFIFLGHGLFMFCLNYNLVYLSSQYLTSGLVAILFSALTFMNIFNSKLFLNTKIDIRVFVSACMGMAGLVLVFYEELAGSKYSSDLVFGILIGLLSTLAASFGNIWVVKFRNPDWSALRMCSYSMLYGGLLTLAFCLFTGREFSLPLTLPFLSSFAFLTLIATIAAFGAYLHLLKTMGPGRAAYVTYLFPLIALTLSAIFEDYKFTPLNLFGIAIVLAGNLLNLTQNKANPITKPV